MIPTLKFPIRSRRRVVAWAMLGFVMLTLLAASTVRAGIFEEGDVLMVQGAPGVIHYHHDPEHADFSWLIGAEWQSSSRWLAGASYFNNSFDQKCQYLYFGKYWPLESIDSNLYFKLSGGVLLGYKEPYENKIPFNHNGVAPGLVPALGYRFGDFNVQVNLLGTAAVMFTAGYDLFK
ncbi:MAG: hypothetical protein V7849_05025 [Candidatus Competibacter sp.]